MLAKLGKKLLLGLKIIGKWLLLTPVLAGFVGLNYAVDTAGIFRSNQFERAIARSMLDGYAVSNYDQMDEQEILKQLVDEMEAPFDTIALGSSRILQMGPEEAGGGSFMNCGVSGSDYVDVMTTFYLFDRADMLPNNVIIGIDPWIFNSADNAQNWRSDKELFKEFLSVALGIETDYEPPPFYEKYEPLVDPAYFQANLRHLFDPDKEQATPTVVTGDLEDQNTNIKLSDGRVMYMRRFRTGDALDAELRARDTVQAFGWIKYYAEPDPELLDLFEQFVTYVQSRGVNVIFTLTPFHPITYYHITENPGMYEGFLLTEPWIAQYSQQNDIPLYGSYNPFITGSAPEDFFDGLHLRGEAMEAYFPGVDEIAKVQKTGAWAASPWFEGRVPVEYEVARQATVLRYEIGPPEVVRQLPDETIAGHWCYVLGRYENSEEDATLLARYAVSQNEGVIYRYDTDLEVWVVDSRFAEPYTPSEG